MIPFPAAVSALFPSVADGVLKQPPETSSATSRAGNSSLSFGSNGGAGVSNYSLTVLVGAAVVLAVVIMKVKK